MLVSICDIKINCGRREVKPADVQALAKSISEVGLLNPITITPHNILIAGNHRLEAAKLLGWTEIECTVTDLQGLQAELAEIDENFVRKNLSPVEFGDLLLRRKEIYESLHPETKAGVAQAMKMNAAIGNNVAAQSAATSKPFVEDTAEKLNLSPRTVREKIQTAKNLTPAAKRIIQNAEAGIGKKDALKLSRLEPDEQEDAATQLAAGEIHSMNEYKKPYSIGGKQFSTFEESVADLKNPNKDASYTPGTLLADMDGLIDRFHRDFGWYNMPQCTVVFPHISREQLAYIIKRFSTITTAIAELLRSIERTQPSGGM